MRKIISIAIVAVIIGICCFCAGYQNGLHKVSSTATIDGFDPQKTSAQQEQAITFGTSNAGIFDPCAFEQRLAALEEKLACQTAPADPNFGKYLQAPDANWIKNFGSSADSKIVWNIKEDRKGLLKILRSYHDKIVEMDSYLKSKDKKYGAQKAKAKG